jgi:integration host factor subunit beta
MKGRMNRSELIENVAKERNLPRRQAEKAVTAIFESISSAMMENDRVEIRGFGSFTTRHYGAYTGRNPRTGEPVPVASKRMPFFKVGKELRERLNPEE